MHWRVFQGLDEQQLRSVLASARRRRFRRDEVVFHDGDPGDTMHLVVKGHFAVRITTPLGDSALVRVLAPGDHFGELAVLEPGPRHGTVVSLEAGETLGLHRDAVIELQRDTPGLTDALNAALVEEVRRLSLALVDALYVPVDRRVWRRLRDVAALYGTEPPITIGITQDDVAQLAGTTRPTANRVLQAGVKEGVVRLGRGRVEVIDLDALERRAR